MRALYCIATPEGGGTLLAGVSVDNPPESLPTSPVAAKAKLGLKSRYNKKAPAAATRLNAPMSPEFIRLDPILREKRGLGDKVAIGHKARETRDECDQQIVVFFHLLPPKKFENSATERTATPTTTNKASELCRAGVSPACASEPEETPGTAANAETGARPPVNEEIAFLMVLTRLPAAPVTALTTPPATPWAPTAF